MDTAAARQFLTRCFSPGQTIAILLRREHPASTAQRIVRVEQAVSPAYLRWLAHENAHGANIYVAANPLRPGSRKRTKESIAEVRHLYLDIDSDGDARLADLRTSEVIPSPSAILSTSPGKYQVLWRVERFDSASQEHTLKLLTLAFGGDPACTDCNRVLRVPGFHNRKYTLAHLVSAEYLSESVSGPDDFRLAHGSVEISIYQRDRAMSSHPRKQTNSEQDWAWAITELTSGTNETELTEKLAFHRSDKPNPRYYAQRTIDLASARLALLAGLPIHDVITRVEERRRSELPAILCTARAREIAHTAARMVARERIA